MAGGGPQPGPPTGESAAPETYDADKEWVAPGEEEPEIAEEKPGAALETEHIMAEKPEKESAADRANAEIYDAGKVKLVKDVFGAEMIEEIKLNE